MHTKTLSIITVNKNNADGLEKTCQSVAWQTFENFEWIVIDGASNDNSVDIIKKYAYKMAHWISEPDTGIYNAMNKGIKLAKGDYCLFLNSGDWLFSPDALKEAFDIIKDLDDADVYYGDCLNSDFTISKMPERLSIDHLYTQSSLSHQNTFINRSLFYDHGFYDENFPTVSDSIFFVKEFLVYRSKFIHIKTIISVYNIGGISSVYKYARKELHGQIKNVMGPLKFFLLTMRIKCSNNIIINIIKYFIPYGIVRYFQKYIQK